MYVQQYENADNRRISEVLTGDKTYVYNENETPMCKVGVHRISSSSESTKVKIHWEALVLRIL